MKISSWALLDFLGLIELCGGDVFGYLELLHLWTLHLLASVVDQDVEPAVLAHVLLDRRLAVVFVHEVERQQEAMLTVLLDRLLHPLSADTA
jgi:hypothetical protein